MLVCVQIIVKLVVHVQVNLLLMSIIVCMYIRTCKGHCTTGVLVGVQVINSHIRTYVCHTIDVLDDCLLINMVKSVW